jgi:hypothetical protein
MEQQEAPLIPGHVLDGASGNDVAAMDVHHPNPNRRPRSALTHLAVLTTVLLPIALLPYCVVSRNVRLLRRRLNEYAVTTARLQRALKTTALENALIRDQNSRVRGLLTEIQQESYNINVETKQALERLRAEGERQMAAQATSDRVLQSDLQKALDEARRSR